jgi:hypothetical protein
VTDDRADLTEPLADKQATLTHRLWHELTEYLIISAYLYVCFGSLIFYKAAILRGEGIEYGAFGFALVKALILGKFILVLHALKIGELGRRSILLADILKTSVLFVMFLAALSIIEELVVGFLHGKSGGEVLSEMAGGTLTEAFAVCVLMLLILIPYFAFRGVAFRLGVGTLWRLLLTERSSPASRP